MSSLWDFLSQKKNDILTQNYLNFQTVFTYNRLLMKYFFYISFLLSQYTIYAQSYIEIVLFRFNGQSGLPNPRFFENLDSDLDTVKLEGIGFSIFLDSINATKEFSETIDSLEIDDFPCYGKIIFTKEGKTDSYYLGIPAGYIWRKGYQLYTVDCKFVQFVFAISKCQWNLLRD